MVHNNFACFILCHGRPDNTPTYNTLRRFGYTGEIYIICDDEDSTLDKYKQNFGETNVKVFNKLEILKKFDTMDSSDKRACAVYARNACFDIASQLGIKYFMELDDDYQEFRFRIPTEEKLSSVFSWNLDDIFDAYLDLFESSPHFTSIALSQTGDYIGGKNSSIVRQGYIRKCMNSWICDVDKPFLFNGRMNDDVNTYTLLGSRGEVFLTPAGVSIDQPDTQQVKGGMTEMYAGEGTYIKSFFTVLCCPSFAKVNMMGDTHYRIHHNINWNNACPKIISGRYKKY